MEISPEKRASNESNRDRFEANPSSSVPLEFGSTIPRKALALLGLSLSDTSSTDKSSAEDTNSDQDNSDEELNLGEKGELDLEGMLQNFRLQNSQSQSQSQHQQMSKAKRDYFSGMDRYELLKVLDPGSQSEVFLVMDTTSDIELVLKRVNLDDGTIPIDVLREASILSDLKHANVIRMDRVLVQGASAFMALDYMPMDLDIHMTQFSDKYPDITRHFMKQILAGIAYCHENNVLHRDIKPENLLVDPDSEVGTLRYRAPEVLLGSTKYTGAVDMWAIGCVFAEMLCSKQAFRGYSEIEVLNEIFRKLGGRPFEESWPGVTLLPDYPHPIFPFEEPTTDIGESFRGLGVNCLDFLGRLLCLDPRARITAEEALHHKWMEGEEMETNNER